MPMTDAPPTPAPDAPAAVPEKTGGPGAKAAADRSARGLRWTGAAVLATATLGVAAYFAAMPPAPPPPAPPTTAPPTTAPPTIVSAPPAIDPELIARLARIEARLAELPIREPAGVSAAETAALAQRLAVVELAANESRTLVAAVESLRRDLAAAEIKRATEAGGLAAQLATMDVPADKVSEPRLRAIEERMAGLATAIEALRGEVAAAAKSLAERTQADTISAARQAAAEARVAATQIASRLRAGLSTGAPFAADLAAARAAWSGNPTVPRLLASLDAHADRGLPTIEVLRVRFQHVAAEAMAAAIVPADANWASGLLRRLASTVTIRPVGDVAGSDAAAVVARTEVRLAANDLSGAVAALAEIAEPPVAAAVGPWLVVARARLAVEMAVQAMLADANQQP
ncbi:MAG: hypothetical protein EXQ89_04115 [Rhodospirillaceae bacterium]|nr:hypothetical protein [Rhodospirillaceae bacterium]